MNWLALSLNSPTNLSVLGSIVSMAPSVAGVLVQIDAVGGQMGLEPFVGGGLFFVACDAFAYLAIGRRLADPMRNVPHVHQYGGKVTFEDVRHQVARAGGCERTE